MMQIVFLACEVAFTGQSALAWESVTAGCGGITVGEERWGEEEGVFVPAAFKIAPNLIRTLGIVSGDQQQVQYRCCSRQKMC